MVEGVVLEAEAPLVVGVLRLGGYVDRKGVCREGVTLVWEQKVEMESESLTKVSAIRFIFQNEGECDTIFVPP